MDTAILVDSNNVAVGDGKYYVEKLEKKLEKAGSSHHDETAKSSQADKETKPSNANKRKQARNQSLGCPPVKAVCAKEEVNKRRSCSRRQSARLKSKGLEETVDTFPMDNAEIPVSSTHDDQIDASGQTILESSTKEEDEENDIPGSEDLGPPAVKVFEVREETEKNMFILFLDLLLKYQVSNVFDRIHKPSASGFYQFPKKFMKAIQMTFMVSWQKAIAPSS